MFNWVVQILTERNDGEDNTIHCAQIGSRVSRYKGTLQELQCSVRKNSSNFGRFLAHSLHLLELHITSLLVGGLGVTCSPQDPRFAGSNQAVVDVFFQDVKAQVLREGL